MLSVNCRGSPGPHQQPPAPLMADGQHTTKHRPPPELMQRTPGSTPGADRIAELGVDHLPGAMARRRGGRRLVGSHGAAGSMADGAAAGRPWRGPGGRRLAAGFRVHPSCAGRSRTVVHCVANAARPACRAPISTCGAPSGRGQPCRRSDRPHPAAVKLDLRHARVLDAAETSPVRPAPTSCIWAVGRAGCPDPWR